MAGDIETLRTQVEQAYARWRACVEGLIGPVRGSSAAQAAEEECRTLQTAYESAQLELQKARSRG